MSIDERHSWSYVGTMPVGEEASTHTNSEEEAARVTLELDEVGSVIAAKLFIKGQQSLERVLVNKEAALMPQLTARIFGVCPAAHAVAAVKALDSIFGAAPPSAARLMRELLYMGHFIDAHALHLFALCTSAFSSQSEGQGNTGAGAMLGTMGRSTAKSALRLRALGQRIQRTIGGGTNIPTALVAGGISFRLAEAQRAEIERAVDEALVLFDELEPAFASALTALVQRGPGAKLQEQTAYMGTVLDGALSLVDGEVRIIGPEGRILCEFAAAEYAKHLDERAGEGSAIRPVMLSDGTVYRVGPLARLNVAPCMPTEKAQRALERFRHTYGGIAHLTALQHHARLIELIYACERAKELVTDRDILEEPLRPPTRSGGRGIAHAEAPRGTLFHDYEVDSRGLVHEAHLLVPTQQNSASLDEALRQAAQLCVDSDDNTLMNAMELAVRCYDPCLSCTSYPVGKMPMVVTQRRRGRKVRELRR